MIVGKRGSGLLVFVAFAIIVLALGYLIINHGAIRGKQVAPVRSK